MTDETSAQVATDGEAALRGSRGALPLPPRLDLPYAKILRELLLARLAVGELTLDAAAVEWLSTPCAQVLLATARAATATGARFLIETPSEALRQALSDFGLDSEFRDWMN
jgi:anti-anti-sigma regulatory factor